MLFDLTLPSINLSPSTSKSTRASQDRASYLKKTWLLLFQQARHSIQDSWFLFTLPVTSFSRTPRFSLCHQRRHTLMEHFRSSPESSDVRLAESLGSVCKHSLRMQISIYDRRMESERRSQALSYLNRSAVNFILDEALAPCSPTDDSDRETEDLPSLGEMCTCAFRCNSGKSHPVLSQGS